MSVPIPDIGTLGVLIALIGMPAVTGFLSGSSTVGIYFAWLSLSYLAVETDHLFLKGVFVIVLIGVAFSAASIILSFTGGVTAGKETTGEADG